MLVVAGLCFAVTSWSADSDPVTMLRSVANELIANLKANKATLKTNRSLVYSLADKIIVPHADIQAMSKRVLPPRIWNNATPGQRAEFQREFTSLLVRTYASALANYTDQRIVFFPVRGGYEGKSEVKVNSQIVRDDGPPIDLNYRLLSEGSQWKLYDLVVEGISMLESFRSQFADQLSQGDMANLIRVLRQHNTLHSS